MNQKQLEAFEAYRAATRTCNQIIELEGHTLEQLGEASLAEAKAYRAMCATLELQEGETVIQAMRRTFAMLYEGEPTNG